MHCATQRAIHRDHDGNVTHWELCRAELLKRTSPLPLFIAPPHSWLRDYSLIMYRGFREEGRSSGISFLSVQQWPFSSPPPPPRLLRISFCYSLSSLLFYLTFQLGSQSGTPQPLQRLSPSGDTTAPLHPPPTSLPPCSPLPLSMSVSLSFPSGLFQQNSCFNSWGRPSAF